jgi:hypothetical protein
LENKKRRIKSSFFFKKLDNIYLKMKRTRQTTFRHYVFGKRPNWWLAVGAIFAILSAVAINEKRTDGTYQTVLGMAIIIVLFAIIFTTKWLLHIYGKSAE